jgi:hypothetical protein
MLCFIFPYLSSFPMRRTDELFKPEWISSLVLLLK